MNYAGNFRNNFLISGIASRLTIKNFRYIWDTALKRDNFVHEILRGISRQIFMMTDLANSSQVLVIGENIKEGYDVLNPDKKNVA